MSEINKRLSNTSNINKKKAKCLLSKEATVKIRNKKLAIKKARAGLKSVFSGLWVKLGFLGFCFRNRLMVVL